MNVSFVYEPQLQDRRFAGPERFDRFLEELRDRLNCAIPALYVPLSQALTLNDFVILKAEKHPEITLANLPADIRKQMAPRIIAIELSGVRATESLERLQIAGAIESMAFGIWRGQDALKQKAEGLFGLSRLAATVGARCSDLLPGTTSENYCLLESDSHYGIPHLVAEYLRSLAQSTPPT